jgi:hypothetical protein
VTTHHSRIKALESLANVWNKAGLNYSVLHGLEDYPRSVGRDLDVCVHRAHIHEGADLAEQELLKDGWFTVRRDRIWAHWLFGFRYRDSKIEGLEIDFLPVMQTGLVRFVNGPSHFKDNKGPFPQDIWGGFVKRIIMQFYGANVDRFRSRTGSLALSASEGQVLENKLEEFFGGRARLLAEFLRAGNINSTERFLQKTRAWSQLRSLLFSKRRLERLCFCLRRFVALNIIPRRVAPIVAIVGPDGVGKSCSIRALEDLMQEINVFPARFYRHWRPNILPPLREALNPKAWFRKHSSNACAQRPRRDSGPFSFLRLFYYSIDFIVGHWLEDARASVRLHPVIYDRHAIDMSIDPARYGLSRPPPGIFRKIVPRPDLIIALIDAPQNIHARKNELSIAEITTQVTTIRNLHRLGLIDRLVEVNGEPQEVAERILRLILENFTTRRD